MGREEFIFSSARDFCIYYAVVANDRADLLVDFLERLSSVLGLLRAEEFVPDRYSPERNGPRASVFSLPYGFHFSLLTIIIRRKKASGLRFLLLFLPTGIKFAYE